MVERRTVLESGIAVATATLGGLHASVEASSGSGAVTGDAGDGLVVNDFETATYPGANELEEWSNHVAFEDDALTDGALRLEYDDGGFFASTLLADFSGYDRFEMVVRGDDGGEEADIDLRIGDVRDRLSNLTDDSIETTFSTVTVDLADANVDRSAVRQLRFDFWHGASGAVEIGELAFVGDGDGGSEITGDTTLAEFYPDYVAEDVPASWLSYLPDSVDEDPHGSHDQVNWPDGEKADAFDVDLEAIQETVEDGTLTFDEMGTQALEHVRTYEAEGFPRQASAKLLPRLSLLPDETEDLTYHNEPMAFWDETAGPVAATNDPDQLIQDPWPPDARDYRPEGVRLRDRAHDQPDHESDPDDEWYRPDVEWTRADRLPDDRYHDDDNPIHDLADGIHPATGDPLGGDGFTANAPMEVEAKIHEENAGFWYQVLQFRNTSSVPYFLNAAVIMWIGPSGANGNLRAGHYNNEQRPHPGYGHPQRDIIEVVHDEDRKLSAYAVRLAFHDEPYNMRTAYPDQYWALEQGMTPPSGRFETPEERQELVDIMAETCHVEVETEMDRNIDLMDAVGLRNRMSN
ncbi:hypothetical protein [Natrinema salaciae]|uniref:Uncharacterized protein n=1 Tax=Natrinema salaciae TaxID=1186196 RepID=A0A1H9IGD1_9EURY|nr:hypothetical protein [Natrinema salaciae]SEQ73532.1 hypothetical protein SAMN04489841_2221 [Natrinema salaciae]